MGKLSNDFLLGDQDVPASQTKTEVYLKALNALERERTKYAMHQDDDMLQRNIAAHAASLKLWQANQRARVELEKIRTLAEVDVGKLKMADIESLRKAMTEVTVGMSAANSAIKNKVRYAKKSKGVAGAWDDALLSITSESMIKGTNLHMPALMDTITMELSGSVYDPVNAVDRETARNLVAAEMRKYGEDIAADSYLDEMQTADQMRSLAGQFRTDVDNLDGGWEDLQDTLTGEGSLVGEENLAAFKQTLDNQLKLAEEHIAYLDVLADPSSEEALEEAQKQNAHRKELDERVEYFMDKIIGDDPSHKVPKLIGAPKFRYWAERNGFDIGTVVRNEEGVITGYSPGKDDGRAIYSFIRQSQSNPKTLVPLHRPNEFIKITYREDVGEPTTFLATVEGPGEPPEIDTWLKIIGDDGKETILKWDKVDKVYSPAEPEPGLDFRPMMVYEKKTPRRYATYPEDISLTKLHVGDDVGFSADDNERPQAKEVTAYGESLGTRAGHDVGSEYFRDEDGNRVYVTKDRIIDMEKKDMYESSSLGDTRDSYMGRRRSEQSRKAFGAGDGGAGGKGEGEGDVEAEGRDADYQGADPDEPGIDEDGAWKTRFSGRLKDLLSGEAKERRDANKRERALGTEIDEDTQERAEEAEEDRVKTGAPSDERPFHWRDVASMRRTLPDDAGEDLPEGEEYSQPRGIMREGEVASAVGVDPASRGRKGLEVAEERSGSRAKREAHKAKTLGPPLDAKIRKDQKPGQELAQDSHRYARQGNLAWKGLHEKALRPTKMDEMTPEEEKLFSIEERKKAEEEQRELAAAEYAPATMSTPVLKDLYRRHTKLKQWSPQSE